MLYLYVSLCFLFCNLSKKEKHLLHKYLFHFLLAKYTFHLIKIKNGSSQNFIDMSNTKEECKDKELGRCSCTNLFRCTKAYRKILSVGEETYKGGFEVIKSESEKVQ